MAGAGEKQWYALRVTYNRELKVKSELEMRGVECFVPMHYNEEVRRGKVVRGLMPSVHNLIFVRMGKDEMQEYKASTTMPIRYIMDVSTNKPLVVPDRQMNNFIAVAGTNSEQLIYLDPHTLHLRSGDRVRVTGGIFAGCEGVFVRIKGDRRIVVEIPGVVAVATAYVHQSLIERISASELES